MRGTYKNKKKLNSIIIVASHAWTKMKKVELA